MTFGDGGSTGGGEPTMIVDWSLPRGLFICAMTRPRSSSIAARV